MHHIIPTPPPFSYTPLPPSNEERAAGLIDAAIQYSKSSGIPIDTPTARLIAACLHHGAGSVLARFAATGNSDTEAALDELVGNTDRLPSIEWLGALWDYLETVTDTNPEQPSSPTKTSAGAIAG